jgi:hypothetical protein
VCWQLGGWANHASPFTGFEKKNKNKSWEIKGNM